MLSGSEASTARFTCTERAGEGRGEPAGRPGTQSLPTSLYSPPTRQYGCSDASLLLSI